MHRWRPNGRYKPWRLGWRTTRYNKWGINNIEGYMVHNCICNLDLPFELLVLPNCLFPCSCPVLNVHVDELCNWWDACYICFKQKRPCHPVPWTGNWIISRNSLSQNLTVWKKNCCGVICRLLVRELTGLMFMARKRRWALHVPWADSSTCKLHYEKRHARRQRAFDLGLGNVGGGNQMKWLKILCRQACYVGHL